MTKQYSILIVLAALCGAHVCGDARRAAAQQVVGADVIPETLARRYGLTRPWLARLQVDSSRGKVVGVTLHEDILLSITSEANVQALDAETGRTLWIARLGRRDLANTPVGASKSYVAVCNGQTLFLLKRDDGQFLFSQKLDGTPSAAPVLSDKRIFIPTFQGAIESYEIDLGQKYRRPLNYRAGTSIDEPPLLAGANVIWGTHKGYVYSAKRSNLQAGFLFKTRGAITAGLAYRAPLVFAASADGYLYALDERSGNPHWQLSTGFPVRETPIVIGDNVYVIPELNGMYCLSPDKGDERWFTRGVDKFVAASGTRLYTTDRTGRTLIIDRSSGAHLDTIATQRQNLKVVNIQNDRIYLATTAGVIQCLREIEQVKPLWHVKPFGQEIPQADQGAGLDTVAASTPEAARSAARAPAEDAGADVPAAAAPPAEGAATDDPFGTPMP